MFGDLRLGIAVLQVQGGDEPVVRRTLLWFDLRLRAVAWGQVLFLASICRLTMRLTVA
jgi:hypothetical protein